MFEIKRFDVPTASGFCGAASEGVFRLKPELAGIDAEAPGAIVRKLGQKRHPADFHAHAGVPFLAKMHVAAIRMETVPGERTLKAAEMDRRRIETDINVLKTG